MPEFGDKKVIKGVVHVRCFETTNIGTPGNPSYAYVVSSGRNRVDWVPEHLVNEHSLTRKRN